MHNTKTTVVVLGIVFCMVALTTTAEAALLRLSQSISARTCTLTIIATDTGFAYNIPNGCGKLMANLGGSSEQPHTPYSQLSGGGSELMSRLLYRVDNTVFLDAAPAQQPADGYMMFAERGSVYTFYLARDDVRGLPRSLEFVAVQPHRVALQFWPGGRVVWFAFDTHTRIDIDHDGVEDAAFRLVHVRDDGTVLLHVSFLHQETAQVGVVSQALPIVAATLIVAGFALLLHEYVREYLLRHRLPNRDWWINHPHDPLQ